MKTAKKWLRSEVDRVAVAEGCYFDEAAALRVCTFIETFCCQSKGRWSGKPIALLDWQRDFLMRLFGWMRPDGLRRYRRAYLEVAKKNGKSTLVSALTLYLLLADREGAPEVYLNACDKDQAGIVFNEAARMVRASTELTAMLAIINSKADKRIVHEAGNGSIIANSSVAGSKDGLNPSATIFDELHRQPDRQLWAVFEYAAASREQPLTISITTAGESQEGVWYEQREYSDKVNAGEILDTQHLGVVYRALETDDLDSPDVWRKANPSLGTTIKEAEFAHEWEEAKLDPVKLANFKRLRLNIIQREDAKFFAIGEWDACSGAPEIDPDDPLYIGFDLASVNDLTAVVGLSGDDDKGFDLVAKLYLPEEDIVELEKAHRVPYRAWADTGHITLTPGNAVDYKFIRRDILKMVEGRNLVLILGDPYGANGLLMQLEQEDGLPTRAIRQGFISMSPPTKELKRLVSSKKIRHGGNPILRWMAGNAVASTDEVENIKLSKKKSRQKIDGLYASVNALAGTVSGDETGGPSIYETRGVLTL